MKMPPPAHAASVNIEEAAIKGPRGAVVSWSQRRHVFRIYTAVHCLVNAWAVRHDTNNLPAQNLTSIDELQTCESARHAVVGAPRAFRSGLEFRMEGT